MKFPLKPTNFSIFGDFRTNVTTELSTKFGEQGIIVTEQLQTFDNFKTEVREKYEERIDEQEKNVVFLKIVMARLLGRTLSSIHFICPIKFALVWSQGINQ